MAGAEFASLLPRYGLIKVTGRDAQAFLQGQFSCDVTAVSPAKSTLGAWCTPKGRVLEVFCLFAQDGAFFIRLPAARLAGMLARLQMFVLRADVYLQDAKDEYAIAGGQGQDHDQGLQTWLRNVLAPEALPEKLFAYVATRGIGVLRLPGEMPRYQICAAPGVLETLPETPFPGTESGTGCGQWELAEINAGLPELDQCHVERYLPQMLNLEPLAGLSFDKGCYPGQEIVARTQYLGRLKQRMYLLKGHDPQGQLQTGSDLMAANDNSGAGKILRLHRDKSGHCRLLAVLNIAMAERQPSFTAADNISLPLHPLPYEKSFSETDD